MAQSKKKKPVKKTTAEKLAEKRERKAEAAATEGALSRTQRIDLILNKNKGTVHRASEANTSYLLRRPTGIPTLDIALGGGFPAAAPSVIVAPDGVGKDYLLWRTMAQSQRLYGDEFAATVYLTEFLSDKRYIRDRCGLKIGMSDGEIDEINVAREKRGLDALTDEQVWHYQETEGQVLLVYGATAEEGFDRILDFVKSNTCQIAAVNSIGFLFTDAKEAAESLSDNPQQRNEALALTKFTTHLATALNRGGPNGERSETSILLINQVRSKDARAIPGRVLTERDRTKPAAEAHALKHGKAIELTMYNGAKIYNGDPAKGAPVVGRTKTWEITKGKLGTHEGKKGEFNYYFSTGADVGSDLITAGLEYDVIKLNGTHNYRIDSLGLKANSRDELRTKVLADEEIMDFLQEEVMKAAPLEFRWK